MPVAPGNTTVTIEVDAAKFRELKKRCIDAGITLKQWMNAAVTLYVDGYFVLGIEDVEEDAQKGVAPLPTGPDPRLRPKTKSKKRSAK